MRSGQLFYFTLNRRSETHSYVVSMDQSNEQNYSVSDIIVHPDWLKNTRPSQRMTPDIALLRISDQIKWSNGVTTILIGSIEYMPKTGGNGIISRWGSSSSGNVCI